jgi:dTDP-4-amino-4,6-dideoxygalactose transaminase
MSIMSGKALPAGEGGMLITNDRLIYERAVALGHYERHSEDLQDPSLKPYGGIAFGGHKYRMHQLTSAMARVQLRHYRKRMELIHKAMNYFWDLLDGTPGIKAHRPPKGSASTMGGWYMPHGLYRPEELGSLSIERFCAAVTAEGFESNPCYYFPLHLHPLLNEADVYGHGKPTRIANSNRDLRQGPGSLPVAEKIPERALVVPWFKKFDAQVIEEHALAFRKVAEHADELI